MTVCIGALFKWNYGTRVAPILGTAALTVSDRMITTGDVEYEPHQRKTAIITPRVQALIAGDYSVHSQAIIATHRQVKGDNSYGALAVAQIYAQALQSVKQREAEDLYLAPLGLNTETFLAQSGEMAEGLVGRLSGQMQSHEGPEVEALIVGSEDLVAHLYHVDSRGTIRAYHDVGFAAIGIGAWHARSRMMQVGYTNMFGYAAALASVYAAKKAAEVAPGIGKETDVTLVLKDGIIGLNDETRDLLAKLYQDFDTGHNQLQATAVNNLQQYLDALNAKTTAETGAERPDTSGSSESTG